MNAGRLLPVALAVAFPVVLVAGARVDSALGDPGRAAYAEGLRWLAQEDPRAAAAAFQEATASADPEFVRRAWHNLALAHLEASAGAEPEPRTEHARSAVAAAMEAIRLGTRTPGVRRNLALALRIAGESGDQVGPPDAGRTDGTDERVGADGEGAERAPRAPVGGEPAGSAGPARMSASEAGRILDALRSGEGTRAAAGILAGPGAAHSEATKRRGPPW
ncbi:MAG TPA: hypothetical protein VLH75_03120 [Longimicrobiales bacterium]|nr:hypothetical protein [Longimicrobiales bacterium]